MAVSVLHTTQAVGLDAGNGEIRKAQWNEEHVLSMATARILGRTTAGTGAAEELTVGSGLLLSASALALSAATVASLALADTSVQPTVSQTLTNKVYTGLKETRVAMGGGTAVDLNLGNYFTKTITGVTTFTASNVPAAGTAVSFILDLTDGGAFAVTWFANTRWPGGVAPTLTASGRDVLAFFTHDAGTTWNGVLLGGAFA